MFVVGPTYLTVSVRAQITLLPGQVAANVTAAVVASLTRYFDPLSGGGNGDGWPFGEDVYWNSVLEVVASTPGVDRVVSLHLASGKGPSQSGNLSVAPTGLVSSGNHSIEVT